MVPIKDKERLSKKEFGGGALYEFVINSYEIFQKKIIRFLLILFEKYRYLSYSVGMFSI